MSRTFEVDPGRLQDARDALDAAGAAIAAGELVVVPTETVYGIACRPEDEVATGQLFAAKRRPQALNLPVLTSSAGVAWDLGVKTDLAGALARRFWPGPLTLVLDRTEVTIPWRLGERTDSIGLRVPDHPLTRGLLDRTGPLAVTSANVTGEPPLDEPEAIRATFGSAIAVYLFLPRGAPRAGGASSTVLDLTSPLNVTRILRQGPLRREEVAEALAELGGRITSERPRGC